jgi:hypothetical protein
MFLPILFAHFCISSLPYGLSYVSILWFPYLECNDQFLKTGRIMTCRIIDLLV